MCKIMEVATMTRRVSQAKKRRRTTHGQQRGSKMCHKQPQMACRMSHKYAHTHAHTLLLRATIVQKRAVKAADHSFAAQSWHCHRLLAEPTAAEREIRSSIVQTQHWQMFSQPHGLRYRHFFAGTLQGQYNEASFIGGLAGSYSKILRFQLQAYSC